MAAQRYRMLGSVLAESLGKVTRAIMRVAKRSAARAAQANFKG